jgi:hypothetical protein
MPTAATDLAWPRRAADALAASVPHVKPRTLQRLEREIGRIPAADTHESVAKVVTAETARLTAIADVWERAKAGQDLAEKCRIEGGLARAERDAAVHSLLGPYTDVQDEYDPEIAKLEGKSARWADELASLKARRRAAIRDVVEEARRLGYPCKPTAVCRLVGISRTALATFIRPREDALTVRMPRDAAVVRGPQANMEVVRCAAVGIAAEAVRNDAIAVLLAPVADGGFGCPNVEVARGLGLTTARLAQLRYDHR